jgi:hypothetical protein
LRSFFFFQRVFESIENTFGLAIVVANRLTEVVFNPFLEVFQIFSDTVELVVFCVTDVSLKVQKGLDGSVYCHVDGDVQDTSERE